MQTKAIKVLKHHSLVAKHAFTYFILFLITIGLIGYFLLQSSSREILFSSEKKLIHSSELIKLQSSKYLENLRSDVKHISKSPYLYQYLNDKKETTRDLVSQEYLSLINSKPYFSQIRFIGIADNGQEIIRVERKDNKVYTVNREELQQKGNREYFLETIRLPKDSMYISSIDLNKEYGQVSLPLTPTLRVAYPVYYEGVVKGIIVINTNLSLLFNSLNKVTDDITALAILNDEGYYLFNEKEKDIFGFEFGKPSTFPSHFGKSPAALEAEHKAVFYKNDKLYLIESIGFPRANYEVFLLISADTKILLRSYYLWRNKSFLIILTLGLLSVAIAFFYMNAQAKELIEITNKINTFSEKMIDVTLPVNRNDEIGALVQSFNSMSTLIRNNVQSLEQAKAEAEQANKEKAEFLENMSHEIRNPLQSISGLVDVLEKNNPAPYQDKIIKSLQFNTSNLHSLVNDILDFKKIELGDIKIHEEWNDLHRFLEEIHGSNNYFAVTRKISLSLETDPTLLDKEILIDKVRLSQIINNLLVNAIKYTGEGGDIVLSVSPQTTAKGGTTIRFSVADTGIGIETKLQKKIKERYFTHQEKLAFRDSFGLGLTIVIQLLELFGSELKIESEKGKGALFYFDITTELRNSKQTNSPKGKTNDSAVLASCRMLIIEDDEQIVFLYQHLFGDVVKDLVIVKSIAEIPNNVKTFDLVFSDYKLGDQTIRSGIEQLKQITGPGSLFYIISAKALTNEEKINSIPVKAFLQKPIETDQLLTILIHDVLAQRYGKPNTNPIKKDYDFVVEKYRKALHLLVSEWTGLSGTLQHSISQLDSEAFYDITHKIITSVRRLELDKFENLLEEVGNNFTQEEMAEHKRKIQEAMDYYLLCIRKELGE